MKQKNIYIYWVCVCMYHVFVYKISKERIVSHGTRFAGFLQGWVTKINPNICKN